MSDGAFSHRSCLSRTSLLERGSVGRLLSERLERLRQRSCRLRKLLENDGSGLTGPGRPQWIAVVRRPAPVLPPLQALAARTISASNPPMKSGIVSPPISTTFAPPPETIVTSAIPITPRMRRRYRVAISRSRIGEPSP